MKTDAIVATQLLMAQAIFELAEHIGATTGVILDAIPFASLPDPPEAGMLNTVNDSATNSMGAVVSGGGSFTVLAFFNGTNWTVVGI